MSGIPDGIFDDVDFGHLKLSWQQQIKDRLLEELELKVNEKLTAGLSDEQLQQFEQIVLKDDQTSIDNWLEQNCPGYGDVVDSCVAEVKRDLERNPRAFLPA